MRRAAISAQLSISHPLERVFAVFGDRRRRLTLLPDNFAGARLLSDHSEGNGARFAFTVTTDRGAYRSVTEVIAWQPPHAVTERTDDGDNTYDAHWQFAPTDAGTLVSVRLEYTPAGNRLLGLLTRRFEQQALRQSLLLELYRLQQYLTQSDE